MTRVFYAVIALGGIATVIANRHFAAASERTSDDVFGRPVRPGSARQRFMAAWSRTMAVVVGTTIFVAGTLGALGVIWPQE